MMIGVTRQLIGRSGNGDPVVFYAEVDRTRWNAREIGIENEMYSSH